MQHLSAHLPIDPAEARAMLRAPHLMHRAASTRALAWASLKAAKGHPITARQSAVLRMLERHATLAADRVAERMAEFDTCPLRPTTPGDAA